MRRLIVAHTPHEGRRRPGLPTLVVPGNKFGIVLLVLGGKGTLGMFNPVL